jgi:hypothetical protein
LNEFCVKKLDEKLDHAELGSSMWKWSMRQCQECKKKSIQGCTWKFAPVHSDMKSSIRFNLKIILSNLVFHF